MSRLLSVLWTKTTIEFDPLCGPPIPACEGWRVGDMMTGRGDDLIRVVAMIQPQRITVVRQDGTVEKWISNELVKYNSRIPPERVYAEIPEAEVQDE